ILAALHHAYVTDVSCWGRHALETVYIGFSSSRHHFIYGRNPLFVDTIPDACDAEATRMRPIYDDGYCLAQGWHGHHPSRADRVAMRRGAPVVSRYTC